jgi:hypothetical protein
MTFSRAQHGAHRERVCPWDLSRDEFCGSVYFFAPIGKFETQRHRATESFGNQTQGCRVLLVDHSVIGGEFRLICIFPTCTPCPLWLCVSNVRAFCFETQRHTATESFGNQTQGCRVLLVGHSVTGGEFRLICILPTRSPCPLCLRVSNVRALVFHWRERILGNIAEFLTGKCQLRGRKYIYFMEGVIV